MKKQTSVPVVSTTIPPEKQQQIAARLTAWYRQHKRDLPWRGASPYAVWISEIMLQQTQVATVIPFFQRFLERFPTVEALASAPIDEALQYWAGLGYYARARNLHRAAQIIVEKHGGQIPDTPEVIETLPGIGRYTAGAILSIAYNVPRPLVDANVIRVLSRVFGLRGDPKSGANQAALWSLAEQLVPEENPGDFNQGLMELGALICQPADPKCEKCPLLENCFAGNSSDPSTLPEFPPGRAAVSVTHVSAILLREAAAPDAVLHAGSAEPAALAVSTESAVFPNFSRRSSLPSEVLIVQRPLHGLWGGLWEFPRVVCEKGETPQEGAIRAAREVVGLDAAIGERIGTVKHGVTHHRITLYGFLARPLWPQEAPRPLECAEARWVSIETLASFAFSSPQVLLCNALHDYLAKQASGNLQSSFHFEE